MQNTIKRYLGIVWLLLSPLTMLFLLVTAYQQIAARPTADTYIQWGVFVSIFVPIAFGLGLFGWYAFTGEYDHLPTDSSEIEDDPE